MTFPPDYLERVYAGVLGKVIGVYLGRPFEGWTYEQISERFGEINYYVHEDLGVPLVVTDDDISGTFTFVRALGDNGYSKEITAAQIGRSWLNYIIENRTILWWGGNGNSTEHTAYLRLKAGIDAPTSGSMKSNGRVVSEQIGAQIFIEGWGLVSPGDPKLAATLAERAARVSHDGEAVYAAQVIAALTSQAFIEKDIDSLLDTASSLIPGDSLIRRLIDDVRTWHSSEPDWRRTRILIEKRYGYDRYGGNCHVVPNHALIILALLYGEGEFQRSLMIVNTAGWDTDCNSANVGCILGVRNGLAGLAVGPDYRGPIADRMYLPTADGGRAITDAASEAVDLANAGRLLAGEQPVIPKDGARYHFELPGSVQGFEAESDLASLGTLEIENRPHPRADGRRALAFRFKGLAPGRFARGATATFVPSATLADYFRRRGYELIASPTLHSGQTVRAAVNAEVHNGRTVTVQLYLRRYGQGDQLDIITGPAAELATGESSQLEWRVPDMGGQPIAFVGLQLTGIGGSSGTVYLDHLTWDGEPDIKLGRPESGGTMWKRAWVDGLDHGSSSDVDPWPEAYRLIQNHGRGLLMHGNRQWRNYTVTADLTPHSCKAGGLAVRVQGMRRYYALLLDSDRARLVQMLDEETCLSEIPFRWQFGETYELRLQVVGTRLTGSIDGETTLEATVPEGLLSGGGMALICEEGRIGCNSVEVRPVTG